MADPDGTSAGEPVAGRYELGRVLGRGGAADVHAALDRRLSRQVAVKLLRATTDDASSRERFVQEAQVLARLSHPGIVTVLDAGFTGDQPFLVMELVDGPTLGQVLARGPLPDDRVADVGAQVADAMVHAHHVGVVHRDIKPGNVVLRDDGRVKVVDFGIARLVGDTVRHTRTGTAVGTAAYLAPEQVLGQPVGAPADVYALGLTLLEALTGERAFPGPPTEAALARLHRRPEVPTTVPAHLGSLIASMTAQDPAERPTAEAVATALRSPVHPTAVLPSPAAPAPVQDGLTRPLTTLGPRPTDPPAGSRSPVDQGIGVRAAAPRRALGARSRLGASATGAVVAVAALVVLLVVVAVVGRGAPSSEVPDGTPPELRDPVGRLHDAVEGG